MKKLDDDQKEAAYLIAFIVTGFVVGLAFLVTIIVFFMSYS